MVLKCFHLKTLSFDDLRALWPWIKLHDYAKYFRLFLEQAEWLAVRKCWFVKMRMGFEKICLDKIGCVGLITFTCMFWLLQLSDYIICPYRNDGSPTGSHAIVLTLMKADTQFFKSLFWGLDNENPQKFSFAGT